MTQRRFPPTWRPEPIPGGDRVVDANGVALAWVYTRDDLAAKTSGSEWLTTDEARRLAIGISRLPELLKARE
ncbi:MAG: hypothetical protein R3D67_21065 [Hyphomicrobiaceae bacterium]